MELPHSFEDQAKSGGEDFTAPPYRIRGSDLDDNFKFLRARKMDGNSPPYKIDQSKDGWKLIPQIKFDVCENGNPVQYMFVAEKI
jgi:hypothetical protein